MGCNVTEPYNLTAAVTKGSLLGLLLFADIAGNAVLYLRVTKASRKWTASTKLIKTLSVVGLLNGIFNILMYLITAVCGKSVFLLTWHYLFPYSSCILSGQHIFSRLERKRIRYTVNKTCEGNTFQSYFTMFTDSNFLNVEN